MTGDPSFSVVIPVFNEAETIDELVGRSISACEDTGLCFEIILVDDGSTDESADKIDNAAEKHPGRVVGIFLNRNYGQHPAVIAGFEHSRGDFVITMDADLQNPPEEIPRLVDTIRKGYDVVGSIRTDRQDSLFRRVASSVINRKFRKWTGIMMHDYGCMMRAYSRPVVDAMVKYASRGVFVPILANSFSKKHTEIPVAHNARAKGRSKYSIIKLTLLYINLLIGMTTIPAPMIGIMGVISSLLIIGFGLSLMLVSLYSNTPQPFAWLSMPAAILMITAGMLSLAVCLLGQYATRLSETAPLYFVHRVTGTSNMDRKTP